MGFDGKTLIHPAQIDAGEPRLLAVAGSAGRGRADRGRLRAAGKRRQGRDRARRQHGRAAASGPGRKTAGEGGRHRRMIAHAHRQDEPMKLYRFLTGPDDASFCHKVTAALNKGWHLFGSPTYAYDAEGKGHALRPGRGEGCRGPGIRWPAKPSCQRLVGAIQGYSASSSSFSMSSSDRPKWWPISWISTWVTMSPSVSSFSAQ